MSSEKGRKKALSGPTWRTPPRSKPDTPQYGSVAHKGGGNGGAIQNKRPEWGMELNETSWMQEVGAQWTDNGVPIH